MKQDTYDDLVNNEKEAKVKKKRDGQSSRRNPT